MRLGVEAPHAGLVPEASPAQRKGRPPRSLSLATPPRHPLIGRKIGSQPLSDEGWRERGRPTARGAPGGPVAAGPACRNRSGADRLAGWRRAAARSAACRRREVHGGGAARRCAETMSFRGWFPLARAISRHRGPSMGGRQRAVGGPCAAAPSPSRHAARPGRRRPSGTFGPACSPSPPARSDPPGMPDERQAETPAGPAVSPVGFGPGFWRARGIKGREKPGPAAMRALGRPAEAESDFFHQTANPLSVCGRMRALDRGGLLRLMRGDGSVARFLGRGDPVTKVTRGVSEDDVYRP